MMPALPHSGTVTRAVLTALLCALAAGAAAPPKKNSFQLATEAAAFKRYQYAVKQFRVFLDSAVGDARIASAQKELSKAWNGLVDQLIQDNREDDAAREYLAMGAYKDLPGTDANACRRKAKSVLQIGFEKAVKSDPVKALRLADVHSELFPADAPLVNSEKRQELAIRAVNALLAERLAGEFAPDVAARCFPDDKVPWDQVRLPKSPRIGEGYLKALADRGWHGKIIYEARREALGADALATNPAKDLIDKAYLARCNAWLAFGNRRMAGQCVNDAQDNVKIPTNLTRANNLGRQVEKMPDGPTEAQPIRLAQAVVNKAAPWIDRGHGYTIPQTIHIGRDQLGGEVSIAPGLLLEGGRIDVDRGKLTLGGMPTQPVIFRNVTVGVSYVGHMVANGAIFDECTFGKIGGVYWIGGYSSKWEFSNCIFYRCRFRSLSQVDYGLKFTGCTFIECDLPKRDLPATDLGKEYRAEWNRLQGCEFVSCTMDPSIAWMANGCNFLNCAIEDQTEFTSTTDLVGGNFATWPAEFSRALHKGTAVTTRGGLNCALAPNPLRAGVPPALWAFLPVYTAKSARR